MGQEITEIQLLKTKDNNNVHTNHDPLFEQKIIYLQNQVLDTLYPYVYGRNCPISAQHS